MEFARFFTLVSLPPEWEIFYGVSSPPHDLNHVRNITPGSRVFSRFAINAKVTRAQRLGSRDGEPQTATRFR